MRTGKIVNISNIKTRKALNCFLTCRLQDRKQPVKLLYAIKSGIYRRIKEMNQRVVLLISAENVWGVERTKSFSFSTPYALKGKALLLSKHTIHIPGKNYYTANQDRSDLM